MLKHIWSVKGLIGVCYISLIKPLSLNGEHALSLTQSNLPFGE